MSAKQVWLIVGIGAILLATVIAFLSLSRRKRTPTPALSQPLLETLKEELFHLESERLKGAISEEEYTLNMQALHVGIQRALAKTKAERAG